MLTIFKKLGIMLWGFKDRVLKSLLEILVWLDQGLGLLIAIPIYLVNRCPKPNADETISSVVGRYAVCGYPWAVIAEWVIDRIFYVPQGCKLGHCRMHIEYDEVDCDVYPELKAYHDNELQQEETKEAS